MSKIWEHSVLYQIVKAYTVACTRTCFRKMKFSGVEGIPSDGAVIFASNHCCTMMDPLVLACKDSQPICFGARSDIFRKPSVAKFLRFTKMLPLARSRNGREAVMGNIAVFQEIVDIITHGVPFCLYPEGTHFPGYELHPLKTGVSKIALQAAESSDKPVYIVPVGLVYESFYDFMKDVSVNIGDPIRVKVGDRPLDIMKELADRMSSLIVRDEPVPVTGKFRKRMLAVISLPFFLLCFILSLPILLPTVILARRLDDRAWMNTVRFGCRYLFFVLWPFHSCFYLLLNFYRKLI